MPRTWQCILVCSQHLLLSFGFSEASDKVTTKQSEVSEDQTEMITDASKDLSTDTSTDAQVTEENSSENTSEAQTVYSADMVIDSDMSAQVETVNYTGCLLYTSPSPRD